MDRIKLATLHEQFDSLKSTSLPQVKRYFRKRIAKCINECKLQASNMKKAVETVHSNKKVVNIDQNEYEFSWGSDFDDYDDDDDSDTRTSNCDKHDNSSTDDFRLDSLDLNDTKPPTPIASRPPVIEKNHSHHLSLNDSRVRHPSVTWSSCKRPSCEPPPPPLPKHPPPNVIESATIINPAVHYEDTYEMMSPDVQENEYLMPNCPMGRTVKSQSVPTVNYDYIHYSHFNSSSDSGSIASSSSRSVSRFDFEAQNDRPLPPIPYEELGLRKFPWYHEVERDQAERMLRLSSIDGAFLVRHSRRAGVENPYTLTLYYSGRIFHLNIRKRPDNLYALGKEKHKEKTFISVAELIRFHKSEPIFVTSKGHAAGKTLLTYTPKT